MPSGFGVGYPGGVNLTWDPVRMNVGSLWAGAFLDIKRHRAGSGGPLKPNGFASVDSAPGRPLARLATPTSAWPADEAGAGEYRFLGYSFDAQRRPTFRYRFGELAVSESFQPRGTVAAGDLRLTRILVFTTTGPTSPGLMFRVLRGADFTAQPGGYLLQKTVTVTTSGRAVMRPADPGQEVLLPVDFKEGCAQLEITYAWAQHHH